MIIEGRFQTTLLPKNNLLLKNPVTPSLHHSVYDKGQHIQSTFFWQSLWAIHYWLQNLKHCMFCIRVTLVRYSCGNKQVHTKTPLIFDGWKFPWTVPCSCVWSKNMTLKQMKCKNGFIVWLALLTEEMNWILYCDQLPKQVRCHYRLRGMPYMHIKVWDNEYVYKIKLLGVSLYFMEKFTAWRVNSI